jgi:hypothetical protein
LPCVTTRSRQCGFISATSAPSCSKISVSLVACRGCSVLNTKSPTWYLSGPMKVHLVDGTYELFRHFFAVPAAMDVNGQDVGAVRGVLGTILSMIAQGATHIGIATDHVVESFRNNLYAGYKTGEGVPPPLLAQFPILETALISMGVVVWPMVEFEADDALASAAAKAAADPSVDQVVICTPDKDLGQCVVGTRVLQLDRRRGVVRDEAGVVEKFGVEAIPKDWQAWHPSIRRARTLAETLFEAWNDVLLYRTLATLRFDVPTFDTIDALRWRGPAGDFEECCHRLQSPELFVRAVTGKQ